MKIFCSDEEYTAMMTRCVENVDDGGCQFCPLVDWCDRERRRLLHGLDAVVGIVYESGKGV